MNKLYKCVLSLGLVVVAGCTMPYATNNKLQYMESRNGPNLNVPPPLTTRNISSFYDLPDQTANAQVDLDPPVG